MRADGKGLQYRGSGLDRLNNVRQHWPDIAPSASGLPGGARLERATSARRRFRGPAPIIYPLPAGLERIVDQLIAGHMAHSGGTGLISGKSNGPEQIS